MSNKIQLRSQNTAGLGVNIALKLRGKWPVSLGIWQTQRRGLQLQRKGLTPKDAFVLSLNAWCHNGITILKILVKKEQKLNWNLWNQGVVREWQFKNMNQFYI